MYDIPRDGSAIYLKLSGDDVPEKAYQVILYAYNQTGNHSKPVDDTGHFIFSTKTDNGTIERELFFHVYNQDSWAFNSKNITLPVGKDRKIAAKVDRAKDYGIQCKAQIVGYRMLDD